VPPPVFDTTGKRAGPIGGEPRRGHNIHQIAGPGPASGPFVPASPRTSRERWPEGPGYSGWRSLSRPPSPRVRIEDYTEDGKYLTRAELPDLDPEKDIEVTVEPRTLTIHAERHEETKQDRHSEFRYGSLTRTVTLPESADPEKITATYDKGVLKVTVPVPEEAKTAGRRVTVEHAS